MGVRVLECDGECVGVWVGEWDGGSLGERESGRVEGLEGKKVGVEFGISQSREMP